MPQKLYLNWNENITLLFKALIFIGAAILYQSHNKHHSPHGYQD